MAHSRTKDGKPWTADRLSNATKTTGPVSLSRTYVYNLLNGDQENPSVAVVETLARTLGLRSAAYFLPGSTDDLDYLEWRDSPEAELLLRTVMGLPEEDLIALIKSAGECRKIKGLPEVTVDDLSHTQCPGGSEPEDGHDGWKRRLRLLLPGGGTPRSKDEVGERIHRSVLGLPIDEE